MIFVVIFVLILAATYMIMSGISSFTYEKKERFYAHLPSKSKTNIFTTGIFRNISTLINRPFAEVPYLRSINAKAKFLKLPFGSLEILLMKELLMVGGGVAGFILFEPMHGVIGAFVGFLLPDFVVNSKVNGKKDALLRVFPETVDIMDLCIGAGLDFLAALRWVVEKSTPSPFIEQLEVVLSEIQVGKSRSEALRDMAKRVKLPDINSFVRTIVQAERMGISIEEALRNLSEDTRMTRFQRGERYAIKAGLKMLIPLMLFILPVILVVVAGPVIIQFTQGDLIPGSGVMQ
ncbi:MAG: type II secretion system F family protein [Candidatus Omnitrophica bacterium]|nr:type II secretion system F family protein [Candidatus Omnitrophota bacterium]